MTAPTSISRPKPYLLTLVWADGLTVTILLETLRDECPCAMCKGEQVMGQTIFAGIKMFKPGMNELAALNPVGNYGIQAKWNDGHDTGIYTWEQLRTIAERFALSPQRLEELSKLESKSEPRLN